MDANFDACLGVVLSYEGGFTALRADPGNWTGGRVGVGALHGTNHGIAARAYPTLDIAALTPAAAGTLYRRDYWQPSGADAHPRGLDLTVFDAAVNSGVGQARRWSARCIHPGRPTAEAIEAYAAARLSFLHALRTWKAFGRGWGERVAGIEARSLRMLLGPGPEAAAIIAGKAAVAHDTARGAARRARTGAGGAVAGPAAIHAAGTPFPVVAAFVLAGLAVAAALAVHAWRQSQRAAAFTHEATK